MISDEPITVRASIAAPREKVWRDWNEPNAIRVWCHASPDWGVGGVANDLRVGGVLETEMHALDGSAAFVFRATYTEIAPPSRLAYTLDDGRMVTVTFEEIANGMTNVTETFDPEHENTRELQASGWQAILDNFTTFVETTN